MSGVILRATNLKKYFPIRKGFFLRKAADLKAVDGVNLEVKRGETLGLVGESGCGKSTLGRTLIRLYEPTAGSIDFNGRSFHTLRGEDLRKERTNIQMIFQDPYASLNPRMTVGQILSEPFRIHGGGPLNDLKNAAGSLLESVGLKKTFINRYPHEFSGGQRQRISIARAIALKPAVVICDEPVSALDVSIQAQILNLMRDLQEQLQLTYLFISHDLKVVEHMSDTVAVMYLGKIVEIGKRDEFFQNPLHPYTQALLASMPKVAQGKRKKAKTITGEVPSPINPPSGCAFHTRCPHKTAKCTLEAPTLKSVNDGATDHQVSCWLY